MVTGTGGHGYDGTGLWGRCHVLYMRSTDSMPLSFVSQASYAAREQARLLEANTGQGSEKLLLKHLEELERSVDLVRAHLLGIQAAAEELRRDIVRAMPQAGESQVWADAYRNIIANRRTE